METKILIVEDELIVAKYIEKQLTDAGYEVVGHAATAKESIKKAVRELNELS